MKVECSHAEQVRGECRHKPGGRRLPVMYLVALFLITGSGWRSSATGPPQIANADELMAVLKSASSADDSRVLEILDKNQALVTLIFGLRLIEAGDQAKSRGDLRSATMFYRLAKHSAALLKNRGLLARSANALGRALLNQERFAEAIQAYTEGRDAYRETDSPNDRIGLAVLLSNLAVAQTRVGHYQEANNSCSECNELLSSLNSPNGAGSSSLIGYAGATCWLVLGDIAIHDADQDRALASFRKSFDLFQEMARSIPSYEAAAIDLLINIADVYKTMGDFSHSLDYFNQAIDRARKSGKNNQLQRALNLLGTLYIDVGDFASAAEFLRESLRIARGLSHKEGIVATLLNLGVTAQRQGRYDEALAHCKEALGLADPNQLAYLVAPLKQTMGVIHQARGEYTEASGYFTEALALAEKAGDTYRQSAVLWRKGELQYLQGNYGDAVKLADASYRISSEANVPLISYLNLSLKGKALLAQRQYKPAGDALTAAIDLIEWMRSRLAGGEEERAYFFQGGKINAYQSMVDLLTAQNKPDQALVYSERAKARVLLDILQHGKANIARAMTAEERRTERALQERLVLLNTEIYAATQVSRTDRSRVTQLEADLDRARLEYISFRNKLYITHPELRPQRAESPAISLRDLGSLVPDSNTAVLEYVVADDKTTLILITRSDAKSDIPDIRAIVIDVNIKTLAGLADEFREQLGNPHVVAHKTSGRLYDLLIRPAEQSLQGRRNVIVVPDRVLWDLPFQALRHESGTYFIEKYSLLYAPSLAVLKEMYLRDERNAAGATRRAPQSSTCALLALGNPNLPLNVSQSGKTIRGSQGLPDLPEAEIEVKSIARLYGPASKV
ncbi:MAG TPA: tetratricopeptide repeat protein, partial [Blastocatellia bacterium]|nr:tetratricopeptide repeat protein [Blastocatellia bacterium]